MCVLTSTADLPALSLENGHKPTVRTQHFLNEVLQPYGTHWKHDY